MKLNHWHSESPVLVENEGVPATRDFTISIGLVVDIEATPLGIVVRRGDPLTDLLLGFNGWGTIGTKAPQQPAGLRKTK